METFRANSAGEILPFASLVKQPVIYQQIAESASTEVADLAKEHWMLMKACVALFCDPSDFCAMDDDLFILKPVSEAQALAKDYDLVFAPDNDNAALYRSIWGDVFGDISLAATARLNGALYWMHMRKDRKRVGELMLAGFNKLSGWKKVHETWAWEQGFYAHLFAGDRVFELARESYWYPYLSGLPGGTRGYDYANNPCGFTMIHFGGDVDKPADQDALALMPQILGDGSPQR